MKKTVITELMKGPTDKSLRSTIPDGTKLLSVETKDGICFVNFSQEFVSKHSGGSAGEYMTVYSIVNSLTELEHIQKVQFLVDGNKLEVFKHMVFNEPFERDASIISK
ncbi:MAG: GerMN domain-containing protein [Clostridiales bacterium]|nr:MAG: GerMN domain-containing protein [Clostridiales bacterium]